MAKTESGTENEPESVRVLLVDDEERVVSLTAAMLEDRFVVHTETSAEDALAYLDTATVDCIVSDYRMPGTDGLAFLRTVRETHPTIPFILSTGKGSEEAASDAISMGVTDYLRKGGADQYAVLANRIENAVAKRRAERALRERERRLAKQRDQLATLDRINVVIQRIIGGLVAAATREEIAATICEGIVGSDLYGVAWIAERDNAGELTVETGAGAATDHIGTAVTDGGGLADPGRRALETGEIQITEDASAAVRPADAEVSRRVAMVPLSYRDVVYGVLGVSTIRPDAFSEREHAGFSVLGEVAGFAINAAQNVTLLLADTTIALTLRVVDESAFPVTLGRRLDCRYNLDGVVPAADGIVLQYVTVEGASPDRVLELAGGVPGIEDARHVSGDGFEFATRSGPVNTAIDVGATVRELFGENDEARVVCEVAADVDVRTVVDAFDAAYEGTELVSKRAVELPLGTEAGFRGTVEGRLTEKQRAAVQAAYFAGYYDWPRESTAEELAASMGVSSPTLHSHLRKAQRKLLMAFLDE